jgi:hypothetical protein
VRRIVEQPQNDAPFSLAEILLAVALEDFRNGAAGRLLDLAVGVDEGQVEAVSQAPADAGLADTHEADEDDRLGDAQGVQLGHGAGRRVLFVQRRSGG